MASPPAVPYLPTSAPNYDSGGQKHLSIFIIIGICISVIIIVTLVMLVICSRTSSKGKEVPAEEAGICLSSILLLKLACIWKAIHI